jgi:tetratricopeptide (TPR) repeat protein
MKLKRQSLVSQGSISRMLQAAQQAWEQADFQQNLEILERASRLAPANTHILFLLAQVHGRRYDYGAAEKYFERAVRLVPNKTEALLTAARMAFDFASGQLAERYFQRALEQKDVSPETIAKLAELYEMVHRLEEASALVDRALTLDAASPSALLGRARLEGRAGRLEEAERLLRTLPTTTDRETRIRSYYELGMVLDRQKRYDEAMSAFLEAKVLLSPDAPPLIAQRQAARAYWKRLQDNISADVLKRWRDSGAVLQPARRIAFLGGYPRSGTTLLEQVLDSHPDIVSTEETTIFYDDAYVPLTRNLPPDTPMLSVLESAQSDALQRLRENYFRTTEMYLGNPIGDRLLVDKNPSVNFLIPAFLRLFPEIKLLIALRDPRDVCLSCFMRAFVPLGKGSVDYLNLESTVAAYTNVMGLWRTLSPMLPNPLLEIRYEDVVEDLEGTSRRVLDFLGAPWDARVLRFNEHARGKQMRMPNHAEVTQPVFRRARGRWLNYRKYFEPLQEKLAPFVKAFGYE